MRAITSSSVKELKLLLLSREFNTELPNLFVNHIKWSSSKIFSHTDAYSKDFYDTITSVQLLKTTISYSILATNQDIIDSATLLTKLNSIPVNNP